MDAREDYEILLLTEKECMQLEDEYEVLIPILNLDVKDSEFRIGDITVKKMGEKSLEEFGMKKEFKNILVKNLYENIVDKTAVIIPIRGNNITIICEDARRKADYAIRVLQVALSSQWGLTDLALLFKQNETIIYRKKNTPSSVVGNWHLGHRPVGLEIDEGYEKRINEFLSIIQVIFNEQNISPKLEECFERALIWIGRSIEEEDLDIKIIKLSIALETILTTINDPRKEEAITARIMLLNDIYFNEQVFKPAEVLRIYKLRSKIVHGSKLGITEKIDYLSMLEVAIHTLIYSIKVIQSKDLKNHNKFIDTLNSHEGREKIIKWLKEQGDKRLSKLIKYMEEIYLNT